MISRQRILIIDDDPHITRILQVILEEAGFETIGATDGKDGLEKVFAQRPDLVLLDIRMPVMDGNIFRQRLREMTKTIPIILVTALTDPDSKAQNLEGGADDYITKPFERRELIARVRAVLRRNATLVSAPRAFYKDAQLRIDFPGYQIWVDSHAIELTPKEWRVLAFLYQRQGHVVPREELLREIWGKEFENAHAILKVHISNLRKKIGDGGKQPRYIQTQRARGYRFESHVS